MFNIDSLVDYVSEQTGNTKKASREAVNAVFEGITSALSEGEDVSIHGYLKIGVSYREGRNGVNPQTGEPLYVKPQNYVSITAGKRLKKAVK